MKIKMASYNIQYGVGQDGVYALDRIINALRGQDIICLQEVTTQWQVCDYDHQPDRIARALNLYSSFCPGFELDASYQDESGCIVNQKRGFGNMVLSRWPILYSRPHSLPRPKADVPASFYPVVDIPRVLLETVICIENTPVRIISVHLSHLPGAQRGHQIRAIKELCASLPNEMPLWDDDPVLAAWTENRATPSVPDISLLFGDFNFEPNSNDYKLMTEGDGAFVDAWQVLNSGAPRVETCKELDGHLTHLDYLFMSENAQPLLYSMKVDQSITASDHFPLYFEMKTE